MNGSCPQMGRRLGPGERLRRVVCPEFFFPVSAAVTKFLGHTIIYITGISTQTHGEDEAHLWETSRQKRRLISLKFCVVRNRPQIVARCEFLLMNYDIYIYMCVCGVCVCVRAYMSGEGASNLWIFSVAGRIYTATQKRFRYSASPDQELTSGVRLKSVLGRLITVTSI